jgi:cytochrome c
MLARMEGMDTSAWVGSSPYQIPLETENGNLIRYGYELIAHTAKYLSPKGIVQQTTNGINYHAPSISNQDTWNLAAYINAQPRPSKDKSKDFPIIATKPIDYPFGPYTDTFSEQQNKFGPFEPIVLAKKNKYHR